ncbi:radical SAM protein [Desulfohalovibrio reitneri]|uniref:radical SAM protein n=1 Tax=Desulfohalovibrio reitneri TaxID=1307759 RepID=UPI000554AE41|nr:radical SAM protein [Desulfohalovibrio reitneri]
MQHVFGPVTSSRLGRSLGLDLLGAPICSMDCLYCEVGPTRELTSHRAAYVPAAKLLDELAQWARRHDAPDVVTLGGMGEPCLNLELEQIIEGCRGVLPGVPVAVLTNSTPLADPAVRAELAGADLVLPSLDSLVESEFAALNRPAGGVTARATAEALLAFREEFAGRVYLEVLLASGINDSEANLELLRDFTAKLRPHRVDVTTLSRPGTSSRAKAADADALERFQAALDAGAQPESHGMAAQHPETTPRSMESGRRELTDEPIREILLSTLRRRPQTPDQISGALALPEERVRRELAEMAQDGLIDCRDEFYAPSGFFE